MRLVDTIPHQLFVIQIFNYNSKYILKIELDQYEQTFKIKETDLNGIEDIKKMITTDFLKMTLERFIQMRNDWSKSYKIINS